MYRTDRGYSIIELMVIVSIVAILAAISIPTYQAYSVRSRISEALAMMGGCKTAITDYLAAKQGLPIDRTASGCESYAGTQFVGDINVVNGTITMTLAATGQLGNASGKTIKLTPSVGSSNQITTWTCTPGDASPVPETLLPGVCRGS